MFKNLKRKSLFLALLFCLVSAPAVVAAPTIQIDGKDLAFDVAPVIENGRVLVPVRVIFEALGVEIQWNEETQTIYTTKGTKNIKLSIDAWTAYVDGDEVLLDAPPRIVDGRTMVPLRFIGQAFGYEVNWEETAQLISIDKLLKEEQNNKEHLANEKGATGQDVEMGTDTGAKPEQDSGASDVGLTENKSETSSAGKVSADKENSELYSETSKAIAVVEKLEKFSHASPEEQSIIISVFKVDFSTLLAFEQLGYTKGQSINSAWLGKEFDLTIEEVRQINKLYPRIDEAVGVLHYYNRYITVNNWLTETQKEQIKQLILKGYTIYDIDPSCKNGIIVVHPKGFPLPLLDELNK